MYTKIKEIYAKPSEFIGKPITIGGWARTVRDGKNVGFIEIYDGSFFKTLQVVAEPSLEACEGSLTYAEAMKLTSGACITVCGTLVESEGAKQPFELKTGKIVLEGDCPSDYALQKKRHSLEFLRTISHLRPRTNTFAATFRVRSLASYAIHKFFCDRGFVYIHTPILTASDCEGAGEMFTVTTLPLGNTPQIPNGGIDYSKDFFGKWAGLTVSGQLAVEAFAMAFRDVYTFGPTFRAEHSNTTTHAAEFWMIEPEIAFADLENVMALAEDMMKYVITYVLDNAPEEIGFFNSFIDDGLLSRLNNVVESEFARLDYTEAVELLKKSKADFEFPVDWGLALQTEHERYITEQVFKKPVFVYNYPRDIKSFYMRVNDDKKTVAAMDLLVPGIGELIGGSQREERLDMLIENMALHKIDVEEYDWYIDLRRYGGVKHGGFGLGFERAIMYLTGMKNIRDVIPYPRTVNNMTI